MSVSLMVLPNNWQEKLPNAWEQFIEGSIFSNVRGGRANISKQGLPNAVLKYLGSEGVLLTGSNIKQIDYNCGYTIIWLKKETRFNYLPIGGIAFTWNNIIVLVKSPLRNYLLGIQEECWHVNQTLFQPNFVSKVAWVKKQLGVFSPLLYYIDPVEVQAKLTKMRLAVPNIHCSNSLTYNTLVSSYFQRHHPSIIRRYKVEEEESMVFLNFKDLLSISSKLKN